MKFISFGDLIEVTYDDSSIELVSKETAAELGYKERQEIKIIYQGKVYTSWQFSKLTGVSSTVIIDYYKKGAHTGEEILALHNTRNSEVRKVKITYNNKIYNTYQFSALTNIPYSTIFNYYKKGITNGEDILANWNNTHKNDISYDNKIYTVSQFSKTFKIPYTTLINNYINKGILDGEQIIRLYTDSLNQRSKAKISYNGKLYSGNQFCQLTGYKLSTVRNYLGKGIRSGEEIISLLNNKQQSIKYVTYKNNTYTRTEFSKLSNIPATTVNYYYKQGMTTGEEMIERYYNKHGRKEKNNGE